MRRSRSISLARASGPTYGALGLRESNRGPFFEFDDEVFELERLRQWLRSAAQFGHARPLSALHYARRNDCNGSIAAGNC